MGDVRGKARQDAHDGQPDQAQSKGSSHGGPEGVLVAVVVGVRGVVRRVGSGFPAKVGLVDGVCMRVGLPFL